MVTDMTGTEVANCSLLDEATAAAEAMFMSFNISNKRANKFFVSDTVYPQTIEVLKTRAGPLGIQLVFGNPFEFVFHKGVFCGAIV
jgi:glycine dehydrogenase